MKVRQLIKEFSLYSVEPITLKLVSFLLIPIYTFYLLPAEFGALQFVISLGTFLRSISQFGMNTAFWKFRNAKPEQELSTLSFNLLAAQLFIGSIVFLLSAVFAFAVDPVWKWPFVIYLAALLIKLVLENYLLVSRAQHNPKQYLFITLSQLVLFIACNVIFLSVFNWGVMGIVMAYLLSFLTTSVLYFPRMKSAVFGSYSLPLLKELMRFGGPLLLGNLSILILSISDRWFLMALSTETELGLYSFGYKFADLLATFMTYAFQLAWTPIAWKSFQSEEGKRFFHEVEKFIMTFFPIIIFLALPVLFSLAQFMTGNNEYRQGLQITFIIALSHVFYAYYIFNSIKNLHYDKKKNLILGNVLAAVLNTLLNIALIKDYGMFGAAWATLISYVFMYVWIECVSIPELAIYRKDRWKLLLLNVLAIGIVTYITTTIREQVDLPILYVRSWLAAVLIFALALALKVISPRYFTLLKSIYSEFRSGKKAA